MKKPSRRDSGGKVFLHWMDGGWFSAVRGGYTPLAACPTEDMVMTGRVCAHDSVGSKLCVPIKPGKAGRQGWGRGQWGKSASGDR